VNLPAKSKMTPPRYQTLLARDVPLVSLPQDRGSVRVIAAEFGGAKGPARTFTPVSLLDLDLRGGHSVRLICATASAAALYVAEGPDRGQQRERDEPSWCFVSIARATRW